MYEERLPGRNPGTDKHAVTRADSPKLNGSTNTFTHHAITVNPFQLIQFAILLRRESLVSVAMKLRVL